MADAAVDYSRAVQLRQSQLAARRSSQSRIKGGGSLRSQGTRPQGAAIVRESELYNRPRNTNEIAANNNLLFQKQQQNKEKWLRDRVNAQAKLQSFIQNPPNIPDDPKLQSDERFQEAQEEYRSRTSSIINRDRQTPSAVRERLQSLQQLKATAKQFEEKAKKIKEAIDKVKKAKDMAWSTYEVASVAETEGALLETVNTSGVLISIYRGAKTILFPQALLSSDPDAGQFLKGFLSFLEPTSLRVKDPTAWVAGIHAIYGYFLLFVVLVIAHVLLVVVAASIIGINEAFNFINP